MDYIKSVDKPFQTDADSATGWMYGGTGKTFPSIMMLTQTWNVQLAEDLGEMMGNEALLGGTNGWYAPAMNIHRTPFSGRNGEYYSEDGYMSVHGFPRGQRRGHQGRVQLHQALRP